MKISRKLFCVLLAAALLVLSVAPAYAVYVDTKDAKIYLRSKDGNNSGWANISISDMTKDTKITDIKSDKKNIVRVSSLDKWSSSYTYFDDPDNNSEYHSADIGVMGMKVGTATVSFKIDGKKYSKKFTVLGYANPVKSFKLTGVSSANLKSKFDKNNYYQTKLKSDSKEGYLEIAAAKGWKITNAEWSDQGEDYSSRNFYSSKGVASVKLLTPKMSKKGDYYIWAECVNTSTKARIQLTYRIGD